MVFNILPKNKKSAWHQVEDHTDNDEYPNEDNYSVVDLINNVGCNASTNFNDGAKITIVIFFSQRREISLKTEHDAIHQGRIRHPPKCEKSK